MIRGPLVSVRKASELVFHRGHGWRRDLFLLRVLISTKPGRTSSLLGVRTARLRLAANLLDAMEETPASLVAATRQLRRIGMQDEALEVVQRVWESRAVDSAEWALACAKSWYDNKRQFWRGDMALAHAMDLAPDWSDVYEEQALNRRWRGNTALSIESARRVMELRTDPASIREWSAFLGAELFQSENFAEAIHALEVGASGEWQDAYRLAVSYERTGQGQLAAEHYAAAGAKLFPRLDPALVPGALHYRWGAMPEAASALGAFVGSTPTVEEERLLLRARALLRLERTSEAVHLLDGRSFATVEAEALRALARELDGRHAEAANAYSVALEAHPRERGRLLPRMVRSFLAAGDPEGALDAWLANTGVRALKFPADPENDPAFDNLGRSARDSFRVGDWVGAVPLLERMRLASSTRENLFRTNSLLAWAHGNLGNTSEAAAALLRASNLPLPHADEAEPEFSQIGEIERYAELRETLPLDRDVVLYESFHGTKTACNPLAVCEELRRERPELRHVWAVRRGAAIHESLLNDPRVSFVQVGSAGYRQHLASAGSLVNNSTFPRYFVRRDGQRYVNTWHGVPWKRMGNEVPGDPFGGDNVARNLLQATHLPFPDKHTIDVMLRTQDVTGLITARVMESGQPRNDRMIHMSGSERLRVRSHLGLKDEAPVVLYAPTWRGVVESVESSIEPFLEAVGVLAERTEATVVLRVHHFVATGLQERGLPDNVRIAPDAVDTNELLAIADVLVSDYSSLIFDYAVLGRPIVKFAYDLEQYREERGLYFGVDEVPGTTCGTPEELRRSMAELLASGLPQVDWSTSPTSPQWGNEDGKAAARVVAECFTGDFTEQDLSPDGAEEGPVLLAVASLNPNGITRSLRNLLKSVPEIAGRVRLLLPRGALDNLPNLPIASEIHTAAPFTLSTQHTAGTRRESLAWRMLRTAKSPTGTELLVPLTARMQRERRRLFGTTAFRSALDFDGYGLYQAALIGLGFPSATRTGYVLHNEFEAERALRFPFMRAIGELLHRFNVLPSVSRTVGEANKSDLRREFGVPESLHMEMPNTIDIDAIRDRAADPLEPDLAEWMQSPGPHAVVAARLSAEKNHDGLLTALSRLDGVGRDLKLLFLGDGPRRAELARLATALGVADRVFLAGQRHNPYPAIAKADALLVPSKHEGQSIALLEALTLGTPVAATNIPGPASVLDGGRLGLLVEPTEEGLERMLAAVAENALGGPEAFDADAYQAEAVARFIEVVLPRS